MTAQLKITPTSEPSPSAESFVLNLCSSTTPMALPHPDSPELKRFSFFVSRRREEGRERFRLHMGYFTSLAEAEEWLNVVRDIYPGAWAGEAPGKRLREKAAAAAVTVAPASKPAPVVVAVPPNVPTIHAVSVETQVTPAAIQTPVSVPAPAQQPTPSPAAVAPNPAKVAPPAPKPLQPGSNVREVMKALDEDTGETRLMPAPPATRVAKSSGAAPAKPVVAAAPEPANLSDSQVLRILEDRRPETRQRADEASAGISLLRPDDSGTRRALKEAVRQNEPVSFAVQLQWSVQRIDMAKVPPLAIFSAYTLYTVEGSREGRKWYGLRLGFFTDAISAKQVASYVRSEFAAVAVIPVSAQERGRATDEGKKSADVATPRAKAPPAKADTSEIKLLDDHADPLPSPGIAAARAQLTAGGKHGAGHGKSAKPRKLVPLSVAAKSSAGTKPATRAGKKSASTVRAAEKRAPQTLEETLEILGASELQIDNGRGEFINDTGVRHLRVEIQKNSPFSRLLDRLSERVRK